MAKAVLHPPPPPATADPEALLAEIARLYHQLRQLPRLEQPDSDRVGVTSAAYLVLEAQIRGLAARFLAAV